jgi:hypothetical protein
MSYVLTGNAGLHRTENGMSNFAWDLVRANDDRTTLHPLASGTENPDFLVWNEPVRLPMAGTLFEVDPDQRDQIPCKERNATPACTDQLHPNGNMVGVQVAPSLFLYFLHLQAGSIPFARCSRPPEGSCPPDVDGLFLPRGTEIGRVGNSGLSVEPHLHMSLLFFDAVNGRSWGVPIEFHNTFLRAEPGAAAEFHEFSQPAPNVWLADRAF